MARVAVIPASSMTGAFCARELLSGGTTTGGPALLRLAFRSEEAASAYHHFAHKRSNVEIVATADAGVQGSLLSVLEGMDTAVLVTPHDHARGFGKDADMSVAMVKAAVDAGCKRIVHVGSWTVKAPSALPSLASRFVPTEEYLRSSAVPRDVEWTVLRGGYFMNNIGAMFHPSLSSGGATIKFPSVKVAMIDARDIGMAAAALCRLRPGAEFAAYDRACLECSGPEMLTFGDVAAKLSAATGRSIAFEEDGVEVWCSGKPPAMQELLRFMAAQQGGAVPFAPGALEPLLGRPPRSFDDFAWDHALGYMWGPGADPQCVPSWGEALMEMKTAPLA